MILENKFGNIPYTTSANIYTKYIGNYVFYFDINSGKYIKIPHGVHEWIVAEIKDEIKDRLYSEYLRKALEMLIHQKYIEPDLTKIKIGKTFFHFAKRLPGLQERVELLDLYITDNVSQILFSLKEQKYIMDSTRINLIYNSGAGCYKDIVLSGFVIIKSFDDIPSIMNITCCGVRIESPTPPTQDQRIALKALLQKKKVYFVLHYGLNLNDFLKDIYDLLEDDYENLSIFYDICLMYTPENQFCLEPDKLFGTYIANHQPLKTIKMSCGAGVYKYFIDGKGDIFPCFRLQSSNPLGNIFSTSAERFVHSKLPISSNHLKKCMICSMQYFCAGGCKAEYSNSVYDFCTIVKSKLYCVLVSGQNKE
jgi:radical SAM protein with 4Fe4S-binding SPASM domain